MTIGVVGRKCGMTRIFTKKGTSIPVSVIEIEQNRVTQFKTKLTDGYCAVQVTVGERRVSRITAAQAGHFVKANVAAGRTIVEFRLEDGQYQAGDLINVGIFAVGQLVDITGNSKGKGFQGTIKRWNFHGQDNTHGNSVSHRVPGSIGQCQTPGRVFKGKKMSGHMGAKRVTVQSLEVVRIDAERNLLLVKGAVPGANSGNLIVRPAVKFHG
ncbi:50S ribosomal protein L3 [Candidatus Pseudomonas adelgestsugas]|uniref:Large ribosomal subunit protein uL3 n=1 Tax=Candidatus Pseudomonas adelgestsugas TaxID=1302376 RepID=A0ABX5R7K8_9PSED|nr:50S ribosomal protein L3 [Candidatus Pseudomonas adelgestsugas]QAX81632.1 50S ribosomal protein L3 [Candidatus Pseudomonas adelgestsugas]